MTTAGPLPGGYSKTAQHADAMIERALLTQARKVASLMARRRKLKKSLRDIESALRTERKFLHGIVQDHTEAKP